MFGENDTGLFSQIKKFLASLTVTLSGDVTGPSNSNTIANGAVNNAKVASNAAIAVSKLAPGSSAQVLLNNGTPTPTWTTITGDGIISNAGLMTVIRINGNTASLSVPNVVMTGKSLGAGIGVSATISAGAATVTHNSHGYSNNDWIVMAGATSSGTIGDFNQLHQISSVTTNTYAFTTTATGTISTPSEFFWFSGARSMNANLIKNITRSATGDYPVTFTNSQNDKYYGIILFPGNSSNLSNRMSQELRENTVSTTGFELFYLDMTNNSFHDPDIYMGFALIGII